MLRIGSLLAARGDLNPEAERIRAGLDLAERDILAAGGIGMELRREDNEPAGDDLGGSTDELASKGVDVVFGVSGSQRTLTALERITKAGMVLISPSNTARELSTAEDCGHYFRTAPSDIHQGRVLARLIHDDGHRTAVVIARDDAYGQQLSEDFAQAFGALGGEVLRSIPYDPAGVGSDYEGEVARAADLNPDSVLVVGYAETARVLSSMARGALKPPEVGVYGTEANMSAFADAAEPGVPSPFAGVKGTVLPGGDEAFLSRLKQVNPTLQGGTYAAQAYDAYVVVALAAAAADSDAPGHVARGLNEVTKDGEKCLSYAACLKLVRAGAEIDYDGVSGPLEFTEQGEPNSGTYSVAQIEPDGSLRILRLASG